MKRTQGKDFYGVVLKEGDYVAYVKPGRGTAYIKTGLVHGFTPKGIRLIIGEKTYSFHKDTAKSYLKVCKETAIVKLSQEQLDQMSDEILKINEVINEFFISKKFDCI